MKIRLTGTVRFNGIEYSAGKELDCSQDVATSLLSSRVAVKVPDTAPFQSVGVASVRETLTPQTSKAKVKLKSKPKTRK